MPIITDNPGVLVIGTLSDNGKHIVADINGANQWTLVDFAAAGDEFTPVEEPRLKQEVATPLPTDAGKSYKKVYDVDTDAYVYVEDVANTEFATQVEVTAGTESAKSVAPDTLKVELDKKVNKPTLLADAGKTLVVNATGTDVEYADSNANKVFTFSSEVEYNTVTGAWPSVSNRYVFLKTSGDPDIEANTLYNWDEGQLIPVTDNIDTLFASATDVAAVDINNPTIAEIATWRANFNNINNVYIKYTGTNIPTDKIISLYYVNKKNELLTVFKEAINEVIQSTIALTGAAPLSAKYGVDTVTGLTYYVSGGNWVASPVSTVDLNTTISDETGVNGTGLLVPSTPPAGTPDIGDLHIEIYDDVKIYFTATATDWLTPTVIETQIDQRTSIFAWGANTSYTIGDLVTAESRTYRRTTNGTSPASFTLDRTNWEVIVPLQAISPWSAATYYYEGETLNVSGRVFRCNTPHTSNGGNFGVDELTNWDRVDNISSSLDYQGSFYYYQGEQITNNKKIYRRIAAGTSGLLFDLTEQTNWELVGGGEVNVVTEAQTKTAHSFVVGDVIYNDGTTWLKASAALGTSIGQAVVSQVIDVNSFKVVYSGILTATAHGKTVGNYYFLDQTVAGTTIITQPTTGIVQQIYFVKDANTLLVDISNAFTAVATTPDVPLTYGRVLALLDLASTTHINTDPGTKIPFTGTTYTSGMTVNAGSIIPSIDGRYRADWLCMAASTDFLADGIFFVVQNGASVGQVSYNMNEASAVNQSAGFIDVDLVAGLEVSLHYRTRHTASDGISWDRGSYFQLTQLPTAVAPIVEYIAENGSLNLASNVTIPPASISPATGVDVLSFTLPSAGTWNVTALLKAFISAGTNSNVVTGIFDSLDTLVVGSDIIIGMVNTNSEQHTGTANVIITTTAAATYTIKAWNTFGFGGSINATPNGATGVRWIKIAGQLPSTGTTVDKVYVRQTTTQGAPTVGTIINLEQVVSGNIPFTGNTVTLEAGKTYLLEGSGAIMAGGSSTYGTRFYNVTTGQFIGDSSFAFSPNNANTPTLVARTAMVEITPTVATQVQLRVDFLSGSGGIIGGSNLVNAGVGAGSNFDPNGASWMRVTQLGSSAVYAGIYPGTWSTYTPVITSTGGTNPTLPTAATITGSYSIQGKTMFLNIRYNSASVTGGADGTGSYQWSIPGGYTIDITKAAIPSVLTNTAGSGLDGGVVGSGFGRNSTGGNSAGLIVMPLSTTTIGAYFEAATRLMGASSLAMTGASNTTYAFVCQIPIL